MFSKLFGKKKDKKSKEEDGVDERTQTGTFKRGHSDRRSVHIAGDRSFGPSNLPACYQSVGTRYARGPKSCPGGEMREEEREMNRSFDNKRNKNRDRGFIMSRREERSSDYSSQDPSPLGHQPRGGRGFYHGELDDSDEDIQFSGDDRIREKLRRVEQERLSLEQQLRNAKLDVQKYRKKAKEAEERLGRYIDVNLNLDRTLQENQERIKEYKRRMRDLQSQLRLSQSMHHRQQFPPVPFPFPHGEFRSDHLRPISSATDPSTSVIDDSFREGVSESLWHESRDSSRRDESFIMQPQLMNNSLLPQQIHMAPVPPPFKIGSPMGPETPRSSKDDDRLLSSSDLHGTVDLIRDDGYSTESSSFRKPLPVVPPRRTSSVPMISPPRRKNSI